MLYNYFSYYYGPWPEKGQIRAESVNYYQENCEGHDGNISVSYLNNVVIVTVIRQL